MRCSSAEWIARNGCALRWCHRDVGRKTEETVVLTEWTAQFCVWKTTGKDSSEACAIACQNCAVCSVFPLGMTSHSKIAQFNRECIGRFRQNRVAQNSYVKKKITWTRTFMNTASSPPRSLTICTFFWTLEHLCLGADAASLRDGWVNSPCLSSVYKTYSLRQRFPVCLIILPVFNYFNNVYWKPRWAKPHWARGHCTNTSANHTAWPKRSRRRYSGRFIWNSLSDVWSGLLNHGTYFSVRTVVRLTCTRFAYRPKTCLCLQSRNRTQPTTVILPILFTAKVSINAEWPLQLKIHCVITQEYRSTVSRQWRTTNLHCRQEVLPRFQATWCLWLLSPGMFRSMTDTLKKPRLIQNTSFVTNAVEI